MEVATNKAVCWLAGLVLAALVGHVWACWRRPSCVLRWLSRAQVWGLVLVVWGLVFVVWGLVLVVWVQGLVGGGGGTC